jgi:hypothetical protein
MWTFIFKKIVFLQVSKVHACMRGGFWRLQDNLIWNDLPEIEYFLRRWGADPLIDPLIAEPNKMIGWLDEHSNAFEIEGGYYSLVFLLREWFEINPKSRGYFFPGPTYIHSVE